MELVDTPSPSSGAPSVKKRSNKAAVIAAAFAALVAGSAATFWISQRYPAAAASTTRTELVAFEPFVANLSDGDGRYLRVTLRLVVEADKSATPVAEDTMAVARLRSAILEILSEQTSSALITTAGKAALKQAIAERVNAALDRAKVTDVLFIEFVIQF